MRKNIVLLQFRSGELEQTEQELFLKRLGIARDALCPVNALREEPFPQVHTAAGLIVCGSGDFYVSQQPSWLGRVQAYIAQCIEANVPTLGICFGHHLIAQMYGAQVVNDARMKELGTAQIQLTTAGATDPLYADFGTTFYAIQGHTDSISDVPPSCTLLAYNETCSVQSFRDSKKNVYGIQFHSEMDADAYRNRMKYYQHYYLDSGMNITEAITLGAGETTDQRLLPHFMSLCGGAQKENPVTPLMTAVKA